MKSQLIVVLVLSCGVRASAITQPDTIPNWQFYYGKIILIEGNKSQTTPETKEITIKNGVVSELNVTVNFDTQDYKNSELEIRIRNKKLKELKSLIKNGSFFFIPIKELIDVNSIGKQYELEFYYSDDRGTKNLRLGTIII
jgi:hypothetical protein